jgi:hypothetical protein
MVDLHERPLVREPAVAATPEPAPAAGRDEAVDVLRGLAMAIVLVNHVQVESWYPLLTVERIGPVSGAELFVVLSGFVLGMVGRRRLVREGLAGVARWLLRRAGVLWAVGVVIGVLAWGLGLLPGVDTSVLTTWTDPATGRVEDLYGSDRGALALLSDLLLLQATPWVFNVMGLYVALLALCPLVLALLARGATLPVLAASWVLYGVHALHPLSVLPSQSEAPFPLLAWQLIFVHGVVVGFHREALAALGRRAWGKAIVGVAAAVAVAGLLFTWSNPWLGLPHLGLIPEDLFAAVYTHAFQRTTPGLGRLLDLAAVVVAGHALLTRLPRVRRWAAGTLVHTVVLVVAWILVRRRVLFRVIPH